METLPSVANLPLRPALRAERRFFAVLFSHIAAGPPPPPPPAIVISSEVVSATADPLDNNRLRIFQPTLGFLSAIGGKYGNYERGYPQVLHGFVLKGFIW